jgi:hypothetical protein
LESSNVCYPIKLNIKKILICKIKLWNQYDYFRVVLLKKKISKLFQDDVAPMEPTK